MTSVSGPMREQADALAVAANSVSLWLRAFSAASHDVFDVVFHAETAPLDQVAAQLRLWLARECRQLEHLRREGDLARLIDSARDRARLWEIAQRVLSGLGDDLDRADYLASRIAGFPTQQRVELDAESAVDQRALMHNEFEQTKVRVRLGLLRLAASASGDQADRWDEQIARATRQQTELELERVELVRSRGEGHAWQDQDARGRRQIREGATVVGEELINAARRDRARYDAVHKFGPVAPLRALFERIEAGQAEFSNFPDEQRQRRWRVLERLLSGRSAFVLGSSHQDDDTAIAEALFPIQSSEGDLLLVVAPRDILESQMVARALSARGYRAGLLGEMDGTERLDILVIDVLGFLMPLYARAVGAFVGGGLHGVRDHNFVEPLLFGAPTWTGPHHFWSPERWDLLQSLAPNLVGELTHDQLHRLPGLLQATDNTPAARRHRAGRLKHFLEASEKLALEGTRELSQDLLTLLRELRADPGQIETCDRREELVYLNLVKHVTVPNVLNVETDWAPHWRLANHVPYLLDLLDRTQPR